MSSYVVDSSKRGEKTFSLNNVKLEFELLKMINKSISGSDIDVISQKIIGDSESRMESPRSIINHSLDETPEKDFNVQKNCTISFLYVLNNMFCCNYRSLENRKFDSFFSLFEECISNYLSGRAREQVIESLMDILLPKRCTNILEGLNIELKLENYYILATMLYFCIVNMNLGSIDHNRSDNKYSKTYYSTGSSMLLPTSKTISEVEDSWILNYIDHNIDKFFLVGDLLEATNIYKTKNINIFDFEYVPQIVRRLIQYLKVGEDYLNDYFLKNNMLTHSDSIGNPFSGDYNQLPFYIGRILEICLAVSREHFVSIFLECDGPLFLLPYIQYSSIQDFFLRFFGIICVIKTKDFNNDNSFTDVEHSNIDESISDKPKEHYLCEIFRDLGVSTMIYNWSVEKNFIQSLIYPISSKFSLNDQVKSKQIFGKDFPSSHTKILLGTIEFISRLVEYLRPYQYGLPVNMMNIGLLWLVYTGEIDSSNNLNPLFGLNIDADSILTYETAYLLSKGTIKYTDSENGSKSKQIKENHISSVFDNSGEKLISRKKECDYSTDMNYNTEKSELDGLGCLDFGVRHHLEKSLQLFNILFVESLSIKYICEYAMLDSESNTDVKIVKLRALNLLEEIIVLAFSKNNNIIGCLKNDIIDILRPYLFKFCDFTLNKYRNVCEFSGEIGNLVSHLTIVKLILLYDDKHELINDLSYEFWDWLLNLFIKKRENSFVAVQCRTIFELGIQYGSFFTLEMLFQNIRLVERLSRFIFDGKGLAGETIDEAISLKSKRIFGSIKEFFIFLGEIYDSLLEANIICENETCLNFKIELLKKAISSQFCEYVNKNQMKNVVFDLSSKRSDNSKFRLNDLLYKPLCSLYINERRRIFCLISALSCRKKSFEAIKNSSCNSNSGIYEDLNCLREECLDLFPNYQFYNVGDSEEYNNSSNNLLESQNDLNCTKYPFSMTNMFISDVLLESLKCCEECKCPEWSFSNVLSNIKDERNRSSRISKMPILSFEESRRIRESRKKQTKLYPAK